MKIQNGHIFFVAFILFLFLFSLNQQGIFFSSITNVNTNGSTGGDGNGSILGTTNQVNVTNGLSRLVGGDANVVLSLPQNIDTSAGPTFEHLITDLAGSGINLNFPNPQEVTFIGSGTSAIGNDGASVDLYFNDWRSILPNLSGDTYLGSVPLPWRGIYVNDVVATTMRSGSLTMSPCSTFQMDLSPQLRFKVDCGSNLITATSQIPTQPGITDIGNSTNRYDELWITDVNATGTSDFKILQYGGQDVLTEVDGNSLYLKLNGTATQVLNSKVANGLDINTTVRPSITLTTDFGTNARRFNELYIRQVNASPGTGNPAIFSPANTAFACGTNTDVCIDFNNGSKSFNFSDTNVMIFGWGVTSANYGLVYEMPSATDVTFNDYSRDGMRYNKIQETGVIPQVYFEGKYNEIGARLIDLNVTDDLNVSGDGNFHLNMKTDGNIFGQLISAGNLIGVSCNTTCGSYSYAGPWTCVEADNVTGASSSCSDVTVAHNCLCRN